ncbi:MAG: carboxypeptidase-like regulatory domain-containing protein, partial [Armatimonadota bacterium]
AGRNSYSTATASTGVVALSNSTQARRNVFTIGSAGQASAPAQVFSLDNGGAFDNVQPAWSRLEPNDLANPNGALYYLAYASTRKPDNTAAATTNIYYVIANSAAASPASPLRPESASNPALLLDTADENFLFNDEYPTFPPFQNALQIGFQSDRQGTQVKPNVPNSGFTKTDGTHDLFVATLFDINAPTLLRWDSSSSTGDIVHINLGDTYNPSPASAVRNRDQGLLPGSTVFFTVRAEDLEAGVDSVYLQFKNPNSKYQSTAQGGNGVEHKEYDPGLFGYLPLAYPFTEATTGGSVPLPLQPGQSRLLSPTNAGREFEAEAISAANPTTYVNHRINRNNKVGPLPIAGEDDLFAFSGGAFLANPGNPATTGVWLKLAPLADAPQQGGPGGTLYGVKWTVPAEASDWYMDVILFDKAVNPLTAQRNNWIIYDNVWGFSTALSLTPQTVDLLVVMDYALGQKFFTSRFGQNGSAFGRGFNNLPNIEYGVESYFTDPEVSRYPDGQIAPDPPGGPATPPRTWDTLGAFSGHGGSIASTNGVGTPNTLGVNSYIDALLLNDAQIIETRPGPPPPAPSLAPARLPSVGRYSLWRILSRGPVPPNLLTDYLPNRSASPPDQFLDANGVPLETTPRTVLQSNRMVIWASPFTANVFAGAGTIQDIQTQDNLRNFVNQGGRLFISGQDIGFALAGNGQSNTFFTDTLKAQLISDQANGVATITAAGTSLINRDAFGGDIDHAYSQHNQGAPNSYSPPTGTLDLVHETSPANGAGWVGDASFAADAQAGKFLLPSPGFLDVVAPIGGAISEYNYGAGSAIISSSNPNGGRVVYAANGFEGISNDYYIYGSAVSVHGRRAEIMHNITCSFRTATVSGRMLDQNGTPITDALVRAVRNGSTENQLAAGTGFTDSSGNYQIVGLAPGVYEVYGYRAGFYTQKSAREVVHGASRATLNLVLRRAGPGGLGSGGSGSGQGTSSIFRADGVTPVPNITVNAVRTDFGQSGSVQVGYTAITSDGTRSVDGVVLPSGQYSFGTQLPIGDYVVTANPRQIVDITGQLVDNPNYNS